VPPTEKKSKMPLMIIIVIVIAVVIALASIFLAMGYGDGDGGGGKTVTMSASELDDDLETEYRENYEDYDLYVVQNFKSLNAGDKLRLEDEITDIDNWGDETEIELGDGEYFEFSGDLTSKYKEGDWVVITLHVIHDSGTITEDGEEIYFDIETFEEVWDKESNEGKDTPLPSSIIKLADSPGGTDGGDGGDITDGGDGKTTESHVEIIPLDAKDAEQDVDHVMFYFKHTGGDPLDLRDYTIKVGPDGDECDISLTTDVRSKAGDYNSTWENATKTLSVNNRVYFSPSCRAGDVDNGDRINIIIINKDTERIVWEKQITVYDS